MVEVEVKVEEHAEVNVEEEAELDVEVVMEVEVLVEVDCYRERVNCTKIET